MNRILRWSAAPAAALALAMAGCGGCKPSEEARAAGEAARAGAAANGTDATRTVVLHAAGMMKSRSGAT